MLVKWNQENIHEFGLRSESGETLFVQLQPGINTLSHGVGGKLVADQMFVKFENLGLVSVLTQPPSASEAESGNVKGVDVDAEFFLKLSIGEAKKQIAETVELKTLNAWLEVEKREAVKAMLQKQIKDVSAKFEPVED